MARVEALVPVLDPHHDQRAVVHDSPLVVRLDRPLVLEEPLDPVGIVEDAAETGRLAPPDDRLLRHHANGGRVVARHYQGQAAGHGGGSGPVAGQTVVDPVVLGAGRLDQQEVALRLDSLARYYALGVSAGV